MRITMNISIILPLCRHNLTHWFGQGGRSALLQTGRDNPPSSQWSFTKHLYVPRTATFPPRLSTSCPEGGAPLVNARPMHTPKWASRPAAPRAGGGQGEEIVLRYQSAKESRQKWMIQPWAEGGDFSKRNILPKENQRRNGRWKQTTLSCSFDLSFSCQEPWGWCSWDQKRKRTAWLASHPRQQDQHLGLLSPGHSPMGPLELVGGEEGLLSTGAGQE